MPKGVIVGDDMPKEEPKEEIVEDPKPSEEPKEEPKEEKLYAGRFKTADDMEKAYDELNTKLGEQGTKLGESEKQNSVLTNQLKQSQKPAPKEKPATDFDAKLQEIASAVEEGDLSISEGMTQSAQISAQIASASAVDGVRQAQEQQVVESSKNQFVDQNPDFFEMQESGALEEVKNSLPGFHDDVSAFFAYKEQQTKATFETAMEEAKAKGFEDGKAEMAKLADGDKNTQKVLQSGGPTAKEIGRKTGPLNKSDLKASGLAALKASRDG